MHGNVHELVTCHGNRATMSKVDIVLQLVPVGRTRSSVRFALVFHDGKQITRELGKCLQSMASSTVIDRAALAFDGDGLGHDRRAGRRRLLLRSRGKKVADLHDGMMLS